jgi:hypothetical protein
MLIFLILLLILFAIFGFITTPFVWIAAIVVLAIIVFGHSRGKL